MSKELNQPLRFLFAATKQKQTLSRDVMLQCLNMNLTFQCLLIYSTNISVNLAKILYNGPCCVMNFRVDSPKSYHLIYISTLAWLADFAKNRDTWQRTWSLKEKRTYNIATNTAKVLITLTVSNSFNKLELLKVLFFTERILIWNSIPITLFVIQADSNYFNWILEFQEILF